MSYFGGVKNVDDGAIPEDGGFAINGGKVWPDVFFDHHKITLDGPMGHSFIDASTGEETKVEYTFCYKRCTDGKVSIFVHHSSVPYAGGATVQCTPSANTAAPII